MQETQVAFVIREDPICWGVTKPVCHNYWACALEHRNCNYWAHELQLLKPMCPKDCVPQEKPLQWEAHAPQQESIPWFVAAGEKPVWQWRCNAAKSRQSCPTLCDPIDSSPPGSPVPGILQARTPEWVAISFSNAWKWKVKVKSLSLIQLFVTPWTAAYQAPPSMGVSRQEYWSGSPVPSPEDEIEPKIKFKEKFTNFHGKNIPIMAIFQATNLTSLNIELRRDMHKYYELIWTGFSTLSGGD